MSMTREELLAKLNSIEWDDIEFKEALWEVPKSALSTVSAFANTSGGHLVFGVRESNGSFVVQGVTDADRVLGNFLGLVRDAKKISVFLPITSQPLNLSQGTVLVFFIPEAQRSEKPVFLDGNPKNAFIRRGGRDDTCTGDELLRFMRDGAGPRSMASCFQISTLSGASTQAPYAGIGIGCLSVTVGATTRSPTSSSCSKWVALQCNRIAHRESVPACWHLEATLFSAKCFSGRWSTFASTKGRRSRYSSSVRWIDRLDPLPEENLFKTWQAVIQFYNKHADHPFGIDAGTLFRADAHPTTSPSAKPPSISSIHQGFGGVGRKPSIPFFRDQTEFFNPGDAFSSVEHLIDPGEKPVRNPKSVHCLSPHRPVRASRLWRRGHLCQLARAGQHAASIENDRVEKTFLLRLTNEKLLTEAQLLAQAQIGVRLTEQEAAVFAYLARKGQCRRSSMGEGTIWTEQPGRSEACTATDRTSSSRGTSGRQPDGPIGRAISSALPARIDGKVPGKSMGY